MNGEPHPLTPQQRLAVSRRALLDALHDESDTRTGTRGAHRHDGLLMRLPWAALTRRVTGQWWQRHPASALGRLALPLLQRYAREHPARLMAASAALGALVLLIRPRRLLAASALLAPVVRRAQVASLFSTLMNRKPAREKKKGATR